MKILAEKRHHAKAGQVIQLSVVDNGQTVCAGSAKTYREAALWAVRSINLVAERVETALIETGWVTEDECTDVANGVLTLDPMPKEEPEVKP